MSKLVTIEQAVRRSHCSHKDSESPEHHCVGTCTITPEGVKLDCKGRISNDPFWLAVIYVTCAPGTPPPEELREPAKVSA